MSGLLNRGMAFLARATEAAGGVTVTYARGPRETPLTATPADSQALAVRLGQVQPAVSAWTERDYLITAAALADAGFAGPPQVGDRVTETLAGEAVTFELMRQTGGGQCWRWSEADRMTYRVHAKRV